MEEKILTGWNWGQFQNDSGQMQDYCNVFVLEPFSGAENETYHFTGQKAMKYGCVSPEVFKGIAPMTKVCVFFDSKKKVSYMVPSDKMSKAIPTGQAVQK